MTETKKSSDQEISALERKIINQVEYYFGDFNLPRDKFLQQQIQLDGGWVPLDVMLKFQRLASLSSDTAEILKALGKSSNSLIEVAEDGKKIRRDPGNPAPDLNETRQKELMSRTVYCKGFPLDETLDVLFEYFGSYGPLENLQMRHYKDKETKSNKFKGSVFAVFKTKELADKFFKLENIKYKETELIRKWQEDYLAEKKKEREEKFNNKGKKNTKKEDKSEKGGDGETTAEGKKPEEITSLPTGSILKFAGLAADITREDLKAALQNKCEVSVAFIELSHGDTEGWIRLKDNVAKEALEKLEDNKLIVCESEVTMSLMSPEEERPLLDKALEFINQKKQGGGRNRGRGGRRRGGGGRGGHSWRGKRRDHSPGPRQSKRARVDNGGGDD